jgi:DNA-binding NtrC family response regulator
MKNPKKLLIFIIDNNKTYRNLINNCLKALDYPHNQMYSSGEECLMKSKRNPDIIIMDYNLGKDHMTGFDFMKIFSKHSASSKYIFLSSNTSIDIAVNTIKWGASDYIIKSKLGIDRLIRRLEILLETKRKISKAEKIQKKILAAVGFCIAALLYGIYVYYNS